MMRLTKHRNQAGLSLVELLVTMVIGLFITVGISSVYLGNKRTSMTTDELSLLQANGRAVIEQLTEVIQHTGYKSTRRSMGAEMFILGAVATSRCGLGADSVVNTALFAPIQNDTPRGDTIGVVYHGDDTLTTDCTGTVIPNDCRLSKTSSTPPKAARIYNYFKADVNAADMPVLTCSGSLNATEEEVAEGVENLQISYGLDANSDGVADRFVNSAAISVNDWGSVVSVNVAVLVRSLRPVAVQASVRSYQLLDVVITPPKDKFLRAVFTTTIRLRNATT